MLLSIYAYICPLLLQEGFFCHWHSSPAWLDAFAISFFRPLFIETNLSSRSAKYTHLHTPMNELVAG